MLHVTRWIYKLTLLLFSAGILSACASAFKSPEPKIQDGPTATVFYEDFNTVWNAAQKVMAKYPMRINNIDKGILESDFVKASEAYRPPFQQKPISDGYRYQIITRVIKGNIRGKGSIKVTVEKIATLKKDFFSAEEPVPSDGFEEQTLLYRIGREIVMKKALDKAQGVQ